MYQNICLSSFFHRLVDALLQVFVVKCRKILKLNFVQSYLMMTQDMMDTVTVEHALIGSCV